MSPGPLFFPPEVVRRPTFSAWVKVAGAGADSGPPPPTPHPLACGTAAVFAFWFCPRLALIQSVHLFLNNADFLLPIPDDSNYFIELGSVLLQLFSKLNEQEYFS